MDVTVIKILMVKLLIFAALEQTKLICIICS